MHLSPSCLYFSLWHFNQRDTPQKDFAMEFEKRARDAGCNEQTAKLLLLKSLNPSVVASLDSYMLSKDIVSEDATMETRVTQMSYRGMIQYLKLGHLAEFTRGMETGP